MANTNAPRDANQVPTLLAVDDVTGFTVPVKVDSNGNLLVTGSITGATVPDGGTGATSFTAYAPIFGGTTSTGALQSGTVGTAGQVLTSNGAGAIATFQSVVGSGTVTSVSVVTANGVSGSVATATTTPAITLTLGAITPTTVNGLTISSTTGTLTITNGKTLASTNTLTLSGTDGTVMTFPSTSATIARTDAANTFTGVQTLSAAPVLSTGTVTVGAATITFPSATGTLPTLTGTVTLTNKRITRRLTTTNAPGATPTTNTDNVDVMNFTGLAAAITSMTTNLSGTPVDGDLVEFRFTDNGTARGITWGASFAATTVALPTTTVISTMLRVLFEWNGSAWACIATA